MTGAVDAGTDGILWYSIPMATKTSQERRTTRVPVTTMEEIPVLDEKEREELLAELGNAESEIRSGRFTEYGTATFKPRLIDIYRRAKR